MTTKGKLAGFVLIVAFVFAGPGSSERFGNIQIMVYSPARATVAAGQSVFLGCGFDYPRRNCSWTLNAAVVNISDRHKYFGFENEVDIQERDCFIGIKMVEEQDAGNWTCTYQGYSPFTQETRISSHSAYLHVTENDKATMLVVIYILAAIVVLVTTIAAGLTYVFCHRRAKGEEI